jgi:hypothetical protein
MAGQLPQPFLRVLAGKGASARQGQFRHRSLSTLEHLAKLVPAPVGLEFHHHFRVIASGRFGPDAIQKAIPTGPVHHKQAGVDGFGQRAFARLIRGTQ